MRMEKKMIVMPALIMITLSMTGVAFAHWSDKIYFEGTIKTGSLTLAFDQSEPPICTEFHEEYPDGPLVLGELYGEDIGHTICSCQDVVMGTMEQGYKTLVIEIQNGYPSYLVHCVFVIRNIGTIPVDICEFIVTDPTGVLTWNPDLSTTVDGGTLVDGGGNSIIHIWHTSLVGEQIDPYDTVKADFKFHIAQDAEECHTYSFEIAIVYTQWEQTAPTPGADNPDGNWRYYREVEISIDHPENYPILVNLPFAADNSIRFLENFNGTKDDIRENEFLSYWVDSDNNQRVWVRRLDNFTSGGESDNAIYSLYEDPLTAPMSSGENTFTYWKTEDFLADWTTTSGSFSESNGILSSTTFGTANIIVMEENRGPGLIYEAKMRVVGPFGGAYGDGVTLAYANTTDYYFAAHDAQYPISNLYLKKKVGGVTTAIITSDWTRNNAWNILGVWWENTTRLSLFYELGCDRVGVSDDGDPALAQGYFGFRMWNDGGQADWFRIRKFVSPEPTTYAGAEQTIQ